MQKLCIKLVKHDAFKMQLRDNLKKVGNITSLHEKKYNQQFITMLAFEKLIRCAGFVSHI